MTGGNKSIDRITIELRDRISNSLLPIYIDVFDNSLAIKWLQALEHLLENQYHLEKNYCFFGFVEGDRTQNLLLAEINRSIDHINQSGLGYQIDDRFTIENTVTQYSDDPDIPAGDIQHEKMNQLHKYFEDLQGTSGKLSPYYLRADPTTKWHIRQLNLLCHEYESLILSLRKAATAPEWRRPSQLMCWLNAPRFVLDDQDLELFGVDTINRAMGGVFVGVNKAVGKHHWEVFNDENRDVDELTTTVLKGQTEAAGDFDIEWARDPGAFHWQQKKLAEFREWLIKNNFDPSDPSLTIGHPQVGQVDLSSSFGTQDYAEIWKKIGQHLDVFSIATQRTRATYDYHWSDHNYREQQIAIIQGH